MFHQSITKSNNNKLKKIIEKNLPERKYGYEIIGADYFRVPVKQINVKYKVLEEKSLNLVEEYILKAGMDLSSPVSIDELSNVLGLDKNLLEEISQSLANLGFLIKKDLPKLNLTDEGKDILDRSIHQVEVQKEIELEHDLFTDLIEEKKSTRYQSDEKFLPDELPAVNWKETNYKNLVDSNLLANISQGNQEIIDITEIASNEKLMKIVGIIVIHDIIEDKIIIRVYSKQEKGFLSSYEKLFAKIINENELPNFCHNNFISKVLNKLDIPNDIDSDYNESQNYNSDLRKNIVGAIKDERKNSEEYIEKAPSVKYLSRKDIWDKYMELIRGAKEEIIILSGFINDFTVDKDYITKLQEVAANGVLILMGWGMDEEINEDLRKKNKKLYKKLSRVKTSTGVNAVSLLWLGEQHQKEIIVDREKHILGSHNFLSYRGDGKNGYSIRYESAFYSELKEGIEDSLKTQKDLFLKAMEREWYNYLDNFESEDIFTTTPLSAWLILEQQEKILNLIENALKNNKYNNEAIFTYLKKLIKLAKEREKITGKNYSHFFKKANNLDKRFQ